MACLCRYTSVIAILPPVFVYLAYEAATRDHRMPVMKGATVYAAGIFAPVLWFLGGMVFNHTWYDFYIQNRVISEAWSRGVTVWNFLPLLGEHILRADTWPHRDSRAVFFSIVFFCCALAIGLFVQEAFLPEARRIRHRKDRDVSEPGGLVRLF